MPADWMIPAALKMVRDMAMDGRSNKAIAAAVEKTFGTFVNGSMIGGYVFRSGLKRKPAPRNPVDQFAWVEGIKPEFDTPDADALIFDAVETRGISSYKLGQWFGVHRKKVDLAFRHAQDAGRLSAAPAAHKELLPYTSVEWPLDRIILLLRLWDDHSRTGVSIARELDISTQALSKKIRRLADGGVAQQRQKNRATPEDRVALRQRLATPDRTPVPGSIASAEFPTGADGRKGSVFGFRGYLPLAGFDKVARCSWSACKSPAEGRWCDWHTDLLKRPAGEIAAALSCQ